jgi:ATP-dependent RNA helicase DDX56/DBP9
VFDYLIATDASIDRGLEDEGSDAEQGEGSDNEPSDEEGSSEGEAPSGGKSSGGAKGKAATKSAAKKGGKSGEVDYGVSRGIDFQGVNFVVNFDFPVSPAAYTHRVGRTGRGGQTGTALSFVAEVPLAASGAGAVAAPASEVAAAARDQAVLAEVRDQQPRLSDNGAGDNVLAAIGTGAEGEAGNASAEEERRMQPAPLQFNFRELESFRYRVEDTLRSVTGTAVRELRAAELKREILNSERLKSFFAENPTDLKVLRHDKAIAHPIRQKDHLKNVPDYLMPASMRAVTNVKTNRRNKKRKAPAGTSSEKRVQASKRRNPLYGSTEGAAEAGEGEGDASAGTEGGDDAHGGDHGEADGEGADGALETDKGGMSGRQQWKMKHKKGAFNPKTAKKNEHRMAGSFIKSKKAK